MIYGKLADLKEYRGISWYLDMAIGYLSGLQPEQLVPGRNEICKDVVYVNCMEYETASEAEDFFEAHREYLDIHVILAGEEKIAVSDIRSMKAGACDPGTDYYGYEGDAEVYLPMDPTRFLIVFPQDAHMVRIQKEQPEKVRKIVVKVLAQSQFV